jgi:hypothetical protein
MGEIPTHFHPVPKQIIHVSIPTHPIPNQLRPNPSQPILSRVSMEYAVVGCHGFIKRASLLLNMLDESIYCC